MLKFRYALLSLISLAFVSCAVLDKVPPPEELVLSSSIAVAAIADMTSAGVESGRLTVDDGQKILDVLRKAERFIEIAEAARKQGDVVGVYAGLTEALIFIKEARDLERADE